LNAINFLLTQLASMHCNIAQHNILLESTDSEKVDTYANRVKMCVAGPTTSWKKLRLSYDSSIIMSWLSNSWFLNKQHFLHCSASIVWFVLYDSSSFAKL